MSSAIFYDPFNFGVNQVLLFSTRVFQSHIIINITIGMSQTDEDADFSIVIVFRAGELGEVRFAGASELAAYKAHFTRTAADPREDR